MVEDTTGKMDATSHPRVEAWKWRSALMEWSGVDGVNKKEYLSYLKKKQLELQSKATELEGFMQHNNIRIYCIKEEAEDFSILSIIY